MNSSKKVPSQPIMMQMSQIPTKQLIRNLEVEGSD